MVLLFKIDNFRYVLDSNGSSIFAQSEPSNADFLEFSNFGIDRKCAVGHSTKIFFVIGLSEIDLTNEIKLYDDIIIGDFKDTYENLALKTLLGYQFSIHYCPSGLFFNVYRFSVVRGSINASRPARYNLEHLKIKNKLNISFFKMTMYLFVMVISYQTNTYPTAHQMMHS